MSATILILPVVRAEGEAGQAVDARDALALSVRALHPQLDVDLAQAWSGRMIIELARRGFVVAPFERVEDNLA